MFIPVLRRQPLAPCIYKCIRHVGGVSSARSLSAVEEARVYATEHGYDIPSLWEQPIVWGDLDSFQHVNNVRYVRFFESGRMKWVVNLAAEVGGPEKSKAMLQARGISLILKSINVKFKLPVTYPDTLLIAHKSHNIQPSRFHLDSIAYSYAQRAVVAQSDAIIVWYDYDKLQKCDAPEDMASALIRRSPLEKHD